MRDIYLGAKGRTVIWRGDMLDLIYHNILDERATSRSSKCIISSAAPVLSSVLMHTPVGTLRTRALTMPKACREPFAVIYGARNGTSHSALTRV